ncbi:MULTISPECIES: hypothetical protein [Nonlabens]|uniref:Uncharacterized protein n=1 Tax=Nonlabens ulvanivorans TaxID=906888 RepID=A0A081D969_NONUL|nr:hypothetical protein [Nonlabens ulvanivorans]PRX12287.1 hypothetical protein LY02_02698 [Nonlabens ulvanivorans]WOI21548.1 hypothetical protein R1T42_07620 [Nonlabens ulvanivorans]GAK75465.1 hypothetical protein JCM19296_1057 [Nonlabens ulvanivorans]GAL01904.1 hypothetical protein JCM19314_1577 [Nonlabens ulvanivorans]GAL75916.1 hypothetical protein JCM19275_140 [Nonlabens ulvanivorans]
MRKYAASLYLFLIGGILVGAGALYRDIYPIFSNSFMVLGYAADLAAVYFIFKAVNRK